MLYGNIYKKRSYLFILLLIIILSPSGYVFAEKAEKYERPKTVSASDIISKALLKGPHNKIEEKVVTYNGFTNHFIISSDFGRFKAVGNGMVPVRIQEINAIAKLDEMKKSAAFVDGLKESSGSMLETSKNLIIHPVNTISGIPSGLYNIFSDTGIVFGKVVKGEATFSEGAEKLGKATVGFSRNKREMAFSLGVNRYSDNKMLQEYLNSVSWATTGGSFTVDLGKMAVAGPAGVALSVIGTSRALNRMMRDNSNPGLERINRKALKGIGLKEIDIDLFLATRNMTPRHTTAITQSLVSLSKAKKREAFLLLATFESLTIDDANMNQAVAAMIAAYNRTKSPITEMVLFENVVMCRNKKGAYVLTYPIDNFYWTKNTAAKTKKVTAAIPSNGKKELWISGKFSELASRKLKELGWEIYDRSLEKLNLGNPY